MKPVWIYGGACLLMAAAPLFEERTPTAPPFTEPVESFRFQHHTLEPIPLDEDVQDAFRGFPGKIAMYQSGTSRWIVRWVTRPTRQLHPAAHCFRASGFKLGEPRIEIDPYETKWGTFTAEKNQQTWRIYEQIRENSGQNESTGTQIWTDTSAWFWAALRGQKGGKSENHGPWIAITRIEPELE